MKKTFGLILIVFALHVHAQVRQPQLIQLPGLQSQLPTHIPMMSPAWELLDTRTYQPNKDGKYVMYFPPPLQAINNKTIELSGYMIPLKAGLYHTEFMLSVLPVLQCQFCGQASIPPMVLIKMGKQAIYSEDPITIKGTLVLNGSDDTRPEFTLTNAAVVQ